jgi:hypothetical protein
MIRIATRTQSMLVSAVHRANTSTRLFSAKPHTSLELDAGPLATRVHHAMTSSLIVLTPLALLLPSDGTFRKFAEVGLAAIFSAHSWVGLNYVCTDYVPKISRALLPPSRIVCAGFAGITFLGLTRIALSSPGGIVGAVKGVWNPLPKKEKVAEQK